MSGSGINCKKCSGENLSAYLDGMLEGDMMRHVAAHLRGCPDCRRAYEGLSKTKSLLHAMPAPSVPANADFWAAAYRQARLEGRARQSRRRLPGLVALGRRWGLATTTAGVALAALLLTLLPISTGNPPAPALSPAPLGPTLDISRLARAHADYAAEQPLADDSRLSIILSDATQTDLLPGAADLGESLGPDTDSSSSQSASTPEVATDESGSLD